MISSPRIGQAVMAWYKSSMRPVCPLHGRLGTVSARADGPGPRNHGVLFDGTLYVVPCDDLRPPDDDVPPDEAKLEHFAEANRRLRAGAAADLEHLVRLCSRWLEMPPGMRRRDPYFTRPYISGVARKLIETLEEARREHVAAGLGINSHYTNVAAMLAEGGAEKWPDGLTDDHVFELTAYLEHLAPHAPGPVATPGIRKAILASGGSTKQPAGMTGGRRVVVVPKGPGQPPIVVLGESRRDVPTIDGREMRRLTEAEFDVLVVLKKYEPNGVEIPRLAKESNHPQPDKILRKLIKKEPRWGDVIEFPGERGRGGIKFGRA
jgi:hypothetical protein